MSVLVAKSISLYTSLLYHYYTHNSIIFKMYQIVSITINAHESVNTSILSEDSYETIIKLVKIHSKDTTIDKEPINVSIRN